MWGEWTAQLLGQEHFLEDITNELFTANKSCDMLWSLPGFVEINGKPTFDAGDAMKAPSTVHEPCHMKSRKPEERQGAKKEGDILSSKPNVSFIKHQLNSFVLQYCYIGERKKLFSLIPAFESLKLLIWICYDNHYISLLTAQNFFLLDNSHT